MIARNHKDERGFTLVELLVAVLIFSIIASIATALVVTSTRGFVTTDQGLQDLVAIETAQRILAADLGQAAHRPSLGTDGDRLPAFVLTQAGFVMVRHGVAGIAPGIQKIAWGFDGKRLLRQTFSDVDGAPPGEAIEILRDIRSIRLRVADDHGWQNSWQPKRAADLPKALEITLGRADGSTLSLRFLVAA